MAFFPAALAAGQPWNVQLIRARLDEAAVVVAGAADAAGGENTAALREAAFRTIREVYVTHNRVVDSQAELQALVRDKLARLQRPAPSGGAGPSPPLKRKSPEAPRAPSRAAESGVSQVVVAKKPRPAVSEAEREQMALEWYCDPNDSCFIPDYYAKLMELQQQQAK
jgi:hypothetical protein